MAAKRSSDRLYVRPEAFVTGAAAAAMVERGLARWLAGGTVAFCAASAWTGPGASSGQPQPSPRRKPGSSSAHHLRLPAQTGTRYATQSLDPGFRRGDSLELGEQRSTPSEVRATGVLLRELNAWADASHLAAEVEHSLELLSAPRSFAGLDLSWPRIMGIVNVTPDSFSDGGEFFGSTAAIEHGLALQAEGADILDVGGESTRPGAEPVPVEEELRRVVPVVSALADAGALVSVDTRRAEVMRAALQAGARIVNDVTALTGDPDSLGIVAASDASVVLMHMQGEPRTMQKNPTYRHAPTEIFDFLGVRVAACHAAGIPKERIAVDPGIGFGKAVSHNLELLGSLPLFAGLGCAVLVGVSRKGFIGRIAGVKSAKDRPPGSLAAGMLALDRGASILRVHDVAATRQAMLVRQAVLEGSH